MEKEKAKEMLNELVVSLKCLSKYEKYVYGFSMGNAELHVGNGFVRKVAEAIGLEVIEKPWKCETTDFKSVATHISFVYEGIKFYELENWRKFQDAGND